MNTLHIVGMVTVFIGLAWFFWGILFRPSKSVLGGVAVVLVGIVMQIVGAAMTNSTDYKAMSAKEWKALERRYDAEALEIAFIAYAIWYEARGEHDLGRRAVASVIWNRADGDRTKLVNVLQRPDWLGKKKKLDDTEGDWSDPVLNTVCWGMAVKMRKGDFKPLGPWTHFYNPDLASPAWGPGLKKAVRIGGHRFGVIAKNP